jgi:threonine/homoserine efflux transporter RhtA
LAIAVAIIVALIFCALGPFRGSLTKPSTPLKPPPPWQIGVMACVWATLWFILVLLAFGIAPQFPPAVAMGVGILLSAAILYLLPRWTAHPDWGDGHQYATVFGVILGSMLLSFVGFIGSLPLDLYFKIVIDALAVLLLIALGRHRRQN